MAHEQQVFVFIENPTGSYMWDVPCIAELFDLEGVYFTTFHMFACTGVIETKEHLCCTTALG